MSVHHHRRDAGLVALGAIGLECAGSGLDYWITGTVGMGAPLLGMVVGIVSGLSWFARGHRGWLTRASLKTLAVWIALVHAWVAGGVWAVGSDGLVGARVVGCVAVGLLLGLSAFVVTLCAGDAVAMVFCPFSDASGSKPGAGPSGPWRRR